MNNNIIKVIIIIGVISLLSTTFMGCSEAQLKVISSEKIAKENCETILSSLDTGDKEGLKNLFCNTVKSSSELDAQIEAAMDFYEGKTVSYDNILSSETGSNRDGKIVEKTINPAIRGIVTDTNKKYEIKLYIYIICAEDLDREGVTKISIESDDGEECIIGKYLE